MKRSLRIALPIALTLSAGVGLWLWKKSHHRVETEKTVEALFEERKAHANSLLESPLAKLILEKNWTRLRSEYQPEKQGESLAKVVRALFIAGNVTGYSPQDQDFLLGLLLQALKSSKVPDAASRGVILAQSERLLPPGKDSPNQIILLGWLRSAAVSAPEYTLAFKKLVTQPVHPESTTVDLVAGQITGSWKKAPESGLIFVLDETRNPEAKLRLLRQLMAQFSKLDAAQRPSALIVLARNLKQYPDKAPQILKISEKMLKSGTTTEVEAALRAIPPLHAVHPLNGEEIEHTVKIMTSRPDSRLSPFAKARIPEIITILQP